MTRPNLLMAGLLLLALTACTVLPVDDSSYARTYYIDPDTGDDANDGQSATTAFRTVAALEDLYPPPDSLVAFKRGAVHRLPATLRLKGGSSAGWVTWGAYGDPAAARPILAGSVAIAGQAGPDGSSGSQPAWQAGPQADTWSLDWSGQIDTGDGRDAHGPEQGPGNLWFFADSSASAAMTAWGWRRQTAAGLASDGDWYYDPAGQTIWLHWSDASPPELTEAAVNRTGLDFSGQRFVILRDLDIRYCGGYALRGHEASQIRFLDSDVSFCGGGTKNGEYVRLGNGFETTGNASDILVAGCRFYQIYDTAFDPQNTGSLGVTQSGLVYRDNVVSHMGLAGCELWLRPGASVLRDVSIQDNVFSCSGRGWGYQQHDHAGQAQVGADVVVFQNEAWSWNIAITGNVFANSRLVLLAEWRDNQALTRDLVRGLDLDRNTWYLGQPDCQGAVLFSGSVGNDGSPALGDSVLYPSLADWQSSSLVPGQDATSTQADSHPCLDPSDPVDQDRAWILAAASNARPTRFGPFGLQGDYTRR